MQTRERTRQWDRRGDRLRRTQNTAELARGLDRELYRKRPPPKPKSSCSATLDPALGLRTPAFHECLDALPATDSLMAWQRTVRETASALALAPPERLAGHRGLLVHHSTGSGKTVTSLGICIAYMRTSRFVCVVTTPANLKDNNAKHYLSLLKLRYGLQGCADVLGLTLAQARAADARDPAGFFAKVAAVFEKRVRFYTYWRFASCLGIGSAPTAECNGREGVAKNWRAKGLAVILDEAHAIANPGRGENPEKSRKLRDFFTQNNQNDLHLYCLTATPGDTKAQWASILSMVRRSDQEPFTASTLTRAAADGLVSHADASGDTTRVAARKNVDHATPMSLQYFVSLLFLLHTMTKTSPAAARQLLHEPPTEFLTKIRAASLVLGPAARTWMGAPGRGWVPDGAAGVKVGRYAGLVASPKLVAALKNAETLPGKAFVFCPEEGTPRVAVIAAEMLRAAGWEDVSDAAAAGRFDPSSAAPKKRFIVYRDANRTPADLARMRRAVDGFRGDGEAYGAAVAARNGDGRLIKIVISTKYEGFDLKALRSVHLPVPFATKKQEKQAEGRGPRLDAHAFLPQTDRNVEIHRYHDVLGSDITRSGLLESLPPRKAALAAAVAKSLDWMDAQAGQAAGGVRSFNSLLRLKARGGRAAGEIDPMNVLESEMRDAAVDCLALRRLHPGRRCVASRAMRQLEKKLLEPGLSDSTRARIQLSIADWKRRMELGGSALRRQRSSETTTSPRPPSARRSAGGAARSAGGGAGSARRRSA